MHACMHTYIHTYIHIHNIYICIYISTIHTYMHACMHAYIHTYIFITYIYTYLLYMENNYHVPTNVIPPSCPHEFCEFQNKTRQLKCYLRLWPRSFIASISRARRIILFTCIILNSHLSMGCSEETLKAWTGVLGVHQTHKMIEAASFTCENSLCLLVCQWSKI